MERRKNKGLEEVNKNIFIKEENKFMESIENKGLQNLDNIKICKKSSFLGGAFFNTVGVIAIYTILYQYLFL